VQNKVLEAMAMGKPVVTTSKGIQGFKAIPEHHLLVGDTPGKFALNVINLLKNERRRTELGQSSRNWVKNNYQWSKNMGMLERLIK